MTESEKLAKLKELLLNEDRDFAQKILQKLDSLDDTINTQDKLSEKVNPIIDEKLHDFVEEIPNKLGPTITKALSEEIKNSQDKVVEALFPIIGKMIKKYIQQEIAILSDRINSQVQNTFSAKKWKRKIKGLFFGFSEEEMIMSEWAKPSIQQLFVIEKGSGLILASASKTETVDEDMIAGMLTAIKSFVEDAFKEQNQSLQSIEYELYEIYIQNFSNYYLAVMLSGTVNDAYKSELENQLLDLTDKHINPNRTNKAEMNQQLEAFILNE
jgi:hypothetical protein